MTPTVFQKIMVEYNHTADVPLDYVQLSQGGYESVAFRPEEGVDKVAARADFCRRQKTFRGTAFDSNLWFADPGSSDSVAAGIPTDAHAWADYVADFVDRLRMKGQHIAVLVLNIEFTGKGYPPWRANTAYKAWQIINVGGYMWQTHADGTSGKTAPVATASMNTVKDGTITWQLMRDGNGNPRRTGDGWNWNELAAAELFASLTDQPTMIQPMSNQADYNLGAWMFRGARCSPQCYGSEPYINTTDPGAEIDIVAQNSYAPLYYPGHTIDRRRIHPCIGAFGQGSFYAPLITKARLKGPFGLCVFPNNNLAPSDYQVYRQFALYA